MSPYLIVTLAVMAVAVVIAVVALQKARTSESRALDQWRARHLAESDARIAATERKA